MGADESGQQGSSPLKIFFGNLLSGLRKKNKGSVQPAIEEIQTRPLSDSQLVGVNNVVVRYHPIQVGVGTAQSVGKLRDHNEDTLFAFNTILADEHSNIFEDSNGEERLFTHTTVPNINWQVIVSRPTAAAFGTQIILRRIVLVAAGTFILIGLFFWGTLTVRVIRPIERLAPISEAIGLNQPISEEDQKHLITGSKRSDQIGNLIQSIIRMKDSIAERMNEQATLLDTSTAVVSSLDPETVLNRILEQMGRLLQIKMYAVIALDETNGSFRIRASRGLSKQFAEQLSIQPSEPDSVTMRALHAREPIQVSDTETDPTYAIRRQRARVEGFRAILAVPLNTQHAPPTALIPAPGTPAG